MKSLVKWICFLGLSASQQVFANDDFNAYRLGDYTNATVPLVSKADKDAVADYYLGRLFLYGYGELKNNDIALRYFYKSAEKGYLPAIQLMAKYSLMHDKNPQEALRWFKQASTAGDVNAQLFVAAAYLYGIGVSKNEDTAARYYIEAAKNGNPIAQFALAEHFISSKHSTNNKLGLIWLTKSANSGNPKALTKLGGIYLNGKIVTKDEEQGVELLTKAADQKYVPALLQLGDYALSQNEYTKAVEWYGQAVNLHAPDAYLQIAHAYLQDKSPIYDQKEGFLWTLKAAQEGYTPAKKELANLYQNGIGVPSSETIANEWLSQVAADEQKKKQIPVLGQAVLWLTNGKTTQLDETEYQMGGILSAWQNQAATRNHVYNSAPVIEGVTRQDIFKPQFALIQPDQVPINVYYDALVDTQFDIPANQWTYPIYPLDAQLESLEKVNSFETARTSLPAPYLNANYYEQDFLPSGEIMDLWTEGWQQKVNYMSLFNHMYFRAILGDAQSQFEIGQMFQYGLGVTQNNQSAIVFYQNAAEQQHLAAAYNLGILFLKNAKEEADYQTAVNWLTDAAFKGNRESQFVLARLLDKGIVGPEGKQYIQVNHDQAVSMLYLSAANNYGPAQYELAEYLSRDHSGELSPQARANKINLIRRLYAGAGENGVAQASLPLAFYNAMDVDKIKQEHAFQVARQQADVGDERAALLLGMLYDRGIGTAVDPAKAIYWYQKSGINPVSQFILGSYSYAGKGLVADQEKGLQQLQSAADAQFAYADFNLAVISHERGQEFLPELKKAYSLGNNPAGILLADYYLSQQAEDNTAKNMTDAKEIYARLAAKGDQYAQLKLAYMLDNGLGAAPDSAGALRWYTASAEQGYPLGQFMLGQFYQKGVVGEPDYKLAKQWYEQSAKHLAKGWVALGFIDETVEDNYAQAFKAYEQAASQGNGFGAYNLGLIYEYGKGQPVAYQKALALYREAANKGIDQAMTQIANMYLYGLGVEKNTQEALSWYKKAADSGNSNASYALGLLAETGVGRSLDFHDALKFYQQAANKGNEHAMLALARMYQFGLGVSKDDEASHHIYEQLAQRQNAYAQYRLGTYYLEETTSPLPDKARRWLDLANANGYIPAGQVVQRLEAQKQVKVSFVEPVIVNRAPVLNNQAADMIYFDALNEWNRGDETMSRMMLQRLVKQYPDFIPAKRTYEQLRRV